MSASLSPWARVVVVVVGLSTCVALPRARAQDAGAEADGSTDANEPAAPSPALPEGPAGPAAHAPKPLSPPVPRYPEAAEKAGIEGDVALILAIDQGGLVTDVEVESGLPAGLTEAAIDAAKSTRFAPATDADGRPTPTRLRWLMHFTLPIKRAAPPAAAPAAAAAPVPDNVQAVALGENATLILRVREKGTGKDLPNAQVFLEDVGEIVALDPRARAERRLGPGAVAVVIRAPGHHQEEFIERLHPGERVERTYFIEKERLNEFETIVHGRPPRAEPGVVTLQAEEIHNVPGTFGDPFRTVMLLPGVGSIMSGIGYPVIRGEAPGQTGTFIDDVRVPLLYHLGFLPAIIHPQFLESLDFHPGNFPAEFGRFTGALIQAHTTNPSQDMQTMLSADLFKLSAYHSHPFTVGDHDASVEVAARYGTLAFLAPALGPRTVIEYWDYQLRGEMKFEHGDLRMLVFGTQDTSGTRASTGEDGPAEPENLLRLGFHRMTLNYRGHWGGTRLDAGVELGPDTTNLTGGNSTPGETLNLRELVARPHVAVTQPLGSKLKLRAGGDLLLERWTDRLGPESNLMAFYGVLGFPRHGLTPGAFVQAEWQPTPRWMISPGVRADSYRYTLVNGSQQQSSIDPRLSVRLTIRPGLSIKGGIGLYHSPPRFILPWPGLSGFGLDRGLNRSLQSTLGAELNLPWDATLDGQIYYNSLSRVTEFSFTQDSRSNNETLTDIFQATHPGRAYGLELIARRRLGHRLFGWVTYSYSRSERNYPGAGWRPADFDQPHLVNAVVSYALGRSWTVSSVYHYNSGHPYTIAKGDSDGSADRNLQRFSDFWRVDLRIEKREAFDTWFLDFYVDWLNISLRSEAVGWNTVTNREDKVLLTIPTIGLQAVF
ncbi:MAG TPA: TonB-dependent receptor [Polyangia bacterium]|nr:TonB-dependent receptor [Polyangia bacterium]